MSTDEQQALGRGQSLRLQILPLLYALVGILAVIASATYASDVAFFVDTGNSTAAAETALAATGAVVVAVASASAAYGLRRRLQWSWYVAAGVALTWTANGIRVIVIDGVTLPSSLVIGLTLLWLLWTERDAIGVAPADRIQTIRR